MVLIAKKTFTEGEAVFIVWGKKHVYKNLGYVADFCPICRRPRQFMLSRIGLASHVYYVTAGQGELVNHERTCQKCESLFNADPANYQTPSKKMLPTADLMKATFPSLLEVYKDRLELEEKVKKAPNLLTPQERDAMIKIPFHLLSPLVERRLAQTYVDWVAFMVLLGALVFLGIVPAWLGEALPDYEGTVIIVCIIAAMLVVGWQVAIAGNRYVKRRIVPVLGPSLKPLKPTENELKAALAELKADGQKMAAKLKIADLQKYF